MKNRFILLFTFALLFPTLLQITGCNYQDRNANTLHLTLEADPITLDPALITDVRSGRISALLFNTLFSYDPQLQLKPDLIQTYRISPDGKTYHFELKEGVLFSNGKTLTAEDVKFSFQRLLDKKTRSPRAWILYPIEGAKEYRDGRADDISGLEIQDPLHFTIQLESPYSPFLSLLSMPNASITPAHIDYLAFSEKPIGTGPYQLKKWKHDFELILNSRKDYFNGPAKINAISFKIMKEPIFISSEFRRGRIDIMQIPGPELSLYQNDPSLRKNIQTQDELNMYYLGLNCQKAPFQNKSLRQALAHAIDKELIIHTIRKDRARILHGPIPLGVTGYDSKLTSYPYKPSLLNKTTLSFDLLIPFNIETLQLAEAVQANLRDANVQVNIHQLEWSAFKGLLSNGDFDAFLLSWWADYPDGENFLFPLFHSASIGSGGNYTGYKNKGVDRLIHHSRETINENERAHTLKRIQEIIIQDAPLIFLYQSKSHIITQAWIKGYQPHPLYNGNKMTDVEIIKESHEG